MKLLEIEMFFDNCVLAFKLRSYAKLNCLKWKVFDIETLLTLN